MSGYFYEGNSLVPSYTENLFALGAAEKIVGITEKRDYPLETGGKDRVGFFGRPDLAKIKALNPDLVVSSGNLSGNRKKI